MNNTESVTQSAYTYSIYATLVSRISKFTLFLSSFAIINKSLYEQSGFYYYCI